MRRRGLNYHRTRLDLVKRPMPTTRHGLVIPIRVKHPILYQAVSSVSLSPPDPNEPSYSDQK